MAIDLAVAGFDGDADGLQCSRCCNSVHGVQMPIQAALTSAQIAAISTAIDSIDDAIATLRSQAKTLASNLSIVSTRQDFTDKMIATLKIGGDNLTLADMNEEGANMLMLQTRQALGIQSLSMASQSAQQVLQLFQ